MKFCLPLHGGIPVSGRASAYRSGKMQKFDLSARRKKTKILGKFRRKRLFRKPRRSRVTRAPSAPHC